MKSTWLCAAVFGLAVTLSAAKPQPSPITYTCLVDSGLMDGNCGGSTSNVLFTGANFPRHVLVVVTDNASGLEVTNDIFDCPGGDLAVTESLETGDYTIDVYSSNGNNFLGSASVTVD